MPNQLPRPLTVEECKALFEFREYLYKNIYDENIRGAIGRIYNEYIEQRVKESKEGV